MLIQCPDCGHSMSRSAHACPECGRPTSRAPAKRGIFTTTFLVIVSIIVSIIVINILLGACCAAPFLLPLVSPDDSTAYVSPSPSQPTPAPAETRKRVVTEPRPKTFLVGKDNPVDVFAACRAWGKDDEFIDEIFSKYVDGRRTVSKSRRIRSARLSCGRRVAQPGNREELDACNECLRQIIDEVYSFKSYP